MSVALRPYFNPLAQAYGMKNYFNRKQLNDLKLDRELYEVLCTDGLHYYILVKSYDRASCLGHLCFCNWGKKYDYVGPFDDLYITKKGTYSDGITKQNYYPKSHRNRFQSLAAELVETNASSMLIPVVNDGSDDYQSWNSMKTPSKSPRRTVVSDGYLVTLDEDASSLTEDPASDVNDEDWSGHPMTTRKRLTTKPKHNIKESKRKQSTSNSFGSTRQETRGSSSTNSRLGRPRSFISSNLNQLLQPHVNLSSATPSISKETYLRSTYSNNTGSSRDLPSRSSHQNKVITSASEKHHNDIHVASSSTIPATTDTTNSHSMTFYYKSSSTGHITKIVLSKRGTDQSIDRNDTVTSSCTTTTPRSGIPDNDIGDIAPTISSFHQQNSQQTHQSNLQAAILTKTRSSSVISQKAAPPSKFPTHSTDELLDISALSLPLPTISISSKGIKSAHSQYPVVDSEENGFKRSQRISNISRMQTRDRETDERDINSSDDDDDNDAVSIHVGMEKSQINRHASSVTSNVSGSVRNMSQQQEGTPSGSRPAIGKFQFFPRNTPKAQIIPVTELLKINGDDDSSSSSLSESDREPVEEYNNSMPIVQNKGFKGKIDYNEDHYESNHDEQQSQQYESSQQNDDTNVSEYGGGYGTPGIGYASGYVPSGMNSAITTPRRMFQSSVLEEDPEDNEDVEVYFEAETTKSRGSRGGRVTKQTATTSNSQSGSRNVRKTTTASKPTNGRGRSNVGNGKGRGTAKKKSTTKRRSKKRKYDSSSEDDDDDFDDDYDDDKYHEVEHDEYDEEADAEYHQHLQHQQQPKHVLLQHHQHQRQHEQQVCQAESEENHVMETATVNTTASKGRSSNNRGKKGKKPTTITPNTAQRSSSVISIHSSQDSVTPPVPPTIDPLPVPTSSSFLLWNNLINFLFDSHKQPALVERIKYDIDTRDSILEHLKFLLQTKYDDFDNMEFNGIGIQKGQEEYDEDIVGNPKDDIDRDHPIFQVPLPNEGKVANRSGYSSGSSSNSNSNSEEKSEYPRLVQKVITELSLDDMNAKAKQMLSVFMEVDNKRRQYMFPQEQMTMDLCADILESFVKINNRLRTQGKRVNHIGNSNIH